MFFTMLLLLKTGQVQAVRVEAETPKEAVAAALENIPESTAVMSYQYDLNRFPLISNIRLEL